jgi:hypothetical protein
LILANASPDVAFFAASPGQLSIQATWIGNRVAKRLRIVVAAQPSVGELIDFARRRPSLRGAHLFLLGVGDGGPFPEGIENTNSGYSEEAPGSGASQANECSCEKRVAGPAVTERITVGDT